MVQILAWFRAEIVRASRSKRSRSSGRPENLSGKILTATSRPRRVSRARNTSPMPPAPSGDRISYGPSFEPAVRLMGAGIIASESTLQRNYANRLCGDGSRSWLVQGRSSRGIRCVRLLHVDEIADVVGDGVGGGVEGEVATIDDVYLGVRHIVFVRIGLGRIERQFVLAPNHQQARLIFLHPGLPLRIVFDVGAIVVEKIDLNIALTGAIEKIIFVGVEIGIVALDVRVVADVARFGGRKRKQILSQSTFVFRAIGPEIASCFPVLS